jgi:glycerophosphoryl diester phosphodiesterase
MKIISHRGLWSDAGEKNSSAAFLKSLAEGFGLETDVRDYMGELVVSHDIPSGGEMPFQELLEMFSLQLKSLPLAINIKSDGIARKIYEELKKYQNINAFVFDMSVPDTRSYIGYKVPFFSRMSEVELKPVWLDKASGVWDRRF